jgi:urease accessory protein
MNCSVWEGNLELNYSNYLGATQLIRGLVKAPLKVQRPFYPEGQEICHTVILHTAGGIVGGDRLLQKIHLQENTRALITTAAATKIYRSNGRRSQQEVVIKIDAAAHLEWLPHETIVFDGAIYQQQMRIELAPGATCLLWEINRFGRTARGEKFVSGEWRSRLEIWQEGKPLWIDRQWLPGNEEIFNAPNGLAGKAIAGSLIWLGKPISEEIISRARDLWQERAGKGQIGVTSTQGNGLLCRYRGNSTSEVKNWFVDIWQLLRLSYFELNTNKSRVWQ